MKKKVLSIVLAFMLVFGFVPISVFAAEIPTFGGGTGTKDDPYLISSADELKELASFINSGDAKGIGISNGKGNFNGYYFKQTKDIDMTSQSWEPIGYNDKYFFAGHYDGDNHFIRNISSNGKQDDEVSTVGIFGWIRGGSVSNLHIDNANFTATGSGVPSCAGGINGITDGGSIINCSVSHSQIESIRIDNSNYAGGISGLSSDGVYKNCSSENNTVKSMAFGGGFVGAIDEGDTTFENCYVAGSHIITSSKKADIQENNSGCFAGKLFATKLAITNCFVYDTVAKIGQYTAAGSSSMGVFAGDQWQNESMAPIKATNCYYGEVNITNNAGDATQKTKDEFINETVVSLLGSAFVQGKDYPILASTLADYSAIKSAKENIPSDLTIYTDESVNVLNTALNAVTNGKTIAEQAKVDAMAKAIEDAIDALTLKEADYTKVDEVIEKAKTLTKDNYKNFNSVENAIASVQRGLDITKQSQVDLMAKTIEDAIESLVEKEISETKGSIGYDIPTVDTNKPIKNVTLGIQDIETAKNIIMNSMNKELQDEVNEKIDQGINVNTVVSIDLIDESQVNKDVKEDLTTIGLLIKEKGMTISKYFDVTISIVAENNVLGHVTETKEALSLQIVIPKELEKEGRTFQIFRLHNGKVEALPVTQKGNVITFTSDKFSTYALVYSDTVINVDNDATPKNDAVKTGDENSVVLYASLAGIVLLGIIILRRKERCS